MADLLDSGILEGKFLLCGDLNCPGPAGTRGLVNEDLLELLDNYSLTQHVTVATSLHGNILDHVFTPADCDIVSGTSVTDLGLSDHFLVSCNISIQLPAQTSSTFTFRNWKKPNCDEFQ